MFQLKNSLPIFQCVYSLLIGGEKHNMTVSLQGEQFLVLYYYHMQVLADFLCLFYVDVMV